MKRPLTIAGVALCLSLAAHAQAAPLTYANSEQIFLASPAVTLTIATGSVADALTVNATSVMVTLSGGEAFTLSSPSYDLSVATSSGGGSATVSCGGGIETATLSPTTGSTVYTVTPGGTNCASASPPNITSIGATGITTNSAAIAWTTNIPADSTVSYGTTASYGATSTDPTLVTAHSIPLSNLNANTLYHYAVASSEYGTSTTSGDNTFTTAAVTSGSSGGGSVSTGGGSVSVSSQYGSPYPSGGGGGGSFVPPPAASTAAPTSSLLAELQSLEAELAALEAQAGQSSSVTTSTTHFTFTRNLSYGMTGSDVKELQEFLIQKDSGPAARKLKAHGATKNFGTLTQNALIEFQKKAGIKPASGFFGPITRAYVNNLTP
jgi:hypothetical protein